MASKYLLGLTIVAVLALAGVVNFVGENPPRPALAQGGDELVWRFDSDPTIRVTDHQSIQGTHVGPRCEFAIPQLSLAPGEETVRRHVTSLDHVNCVLTYEQGAAIKTVPEDSGASIEGDREFFSLSAGSKGNSVVLHPFSPPAGYQQAHYKIEWWDIANIEVNAAYSYLFWARNGSCVTDGWGEPFLWWQNATGWQYVSHLFDAFYSPGLGCTRVQAEMYWAQFHNGVFCAGQNTDTYYDGVIVAGDSSGNIFGWHNNTWTSEPWWCPPLHWTDELGYDY